MEDQTACGAGAGNCPTAEMHYTKSSCLFIGPGCQGWAGEAMERVRMEKDWVRVDPRASAKATWQGGLWTCVRNAGLSMSRAHAQMCSPGLSSQLPPRFSNALVVHLLWCGEGRFALWDLPWRTLQLPIWRPEKSQIGLLLGARHLSYFCKCKIRKLLTYIRDKIAY